MSYDTWHTYGYGICVSDIEDPPVVLSLRTFCRSYPEFAGNGAGIAEKYSGMAG